MNPVALDSRPWRDWGTALTVHGLLLVAALSASLIRRAEPPTVVPLDVTMQWQQAIAAEPAPTPESARKDQAGPAPAPRMQMARRLPPAQPDLTPRPATLPPPATPAPAPALSTAPTAALATTDTPVANAAPSSATEASHASTTTASAQPNPGGEHRWQALLESLLARDKHYPISARRARQEGVVLIEAHFTADGQLQRCAVLNGSGFDVLDEAAVLMVRRAASNARLQQTPGRNAWLRIPVTFNLEDS